MLHFPLEAWTSRIPIPLVWRDTLVRVACWVVSPNCWLTPLLVRPVSPTHLPFKSAGSHKMDSFHQTAKRGPPFTKPFLTLFPVRPQAPGFCLGVFWPPEGSQRHLALKSQQWGQPRISASHLVVWNRIGGGETQQIPIYHLEEPRVS